MTAQNRGGGEPQINGICTVEHLFVTSARKLSIWVKASSSIKQIRGQMQKKTDLSNDGNNTLFLLRLTSETDTTQ